MTIPGTKQRERMRDAPIKQKLVAMILATTAAALFLAGAVIVLSDSVLFKGYLRRDLSALARIIADNSTAALAFGDPKSATETLGALRDRTHVVGACIYRSDSPGADHSIFATYSRRGAMVCPPAGEQEEIVFGANDVIVTQPVILSGKRIGTLVIRYDLDEIAERVRLYGGTVFGALLASAMLAVLISSRLRAVIERPISTLARAASAVAETGDYSIRAQRFSHDELGLLADRFNEMLAGIQSRDIAIKAERERFRFMAESMPQKIFTTHPNGIVDYLNLQWSEFNGDVSDPESWIWSKFVHPDDAEETARLWKESIETGEPFRMEHRFRRADGRYRWHLTRAHAMRDESGTISMWIGSNTEIHEQKEKEEALRRANDDLQQFAYSASHDLQEPIRNVAVYSEIVARKYDDVLDDDGRQFLGFLREGGRRLATLVSDLLAYTRASTAELSEVQVDASEVLRASLASLSEAIRESNAVVTYDALPEVFMGESHLQQVLQNLVGNALKYRDEKTPKIHISAVSQGPFWRFSVQDNGIGIDPQYREKIFGIFKRLHHDRTYSGTGIGLAICQRVVERYGGRIWVQSEPGKGSTFCFTIPRSALPASPATLGTPAGGG